MEFPSAEEIAEYLKDTVFHGFTEFAGVECDDLTFTIATALRDRFASTSFNVQEWLDTMGPTFITPDGVYNKIKIIVGLRVASAAAGVPMNLVVAKNTALDWCDKNPIR
jgi:phage major head subunit gpT-like protein